LRREAAAQRGIEQFFSTSECFAKIKVIRKEIAFQINESV
jgi:hypothetical protein